MLADWLAHWAAATPERTALVAGGRAWTFAELHVDVDRLAERLRQAGVRAGHRVATLMPNGAGFPMLVHAALRLGATIVPLNTRLADAELAWQVADVAPRLLMADASTSARAHGICADCPGMTVMHLDAESPPALPTDADPQMVVPNDAGAAAVLDPDAVLAIVYTSGTTGRPRGAMLTVGNFWWSAIGSALNLGTHADDRWLACLPLFHVGGLSIVLRAAIGGFTVVVHDGFDADAVNRAIDEDRITTISVVAVMLQRVLDARGDVPYPRSLRTVLVGGGPVPRTLLDRCITLGIPVVQTYGLTETTSQVVTLAHADVRRRNGAAGRPLYPNRIRIARDDRDAPAGEPGEILVHGPVVMAGYAGRPDDTARTIIDGWLHTGDIGYVDSDGFLFVLDRRDDLIVTGGENVYPAEVEGVLLEFPGVIEAGVIGVTDETWGQRVVAVVRVDATPGPDFADALRAHCRSRLAGYKTPREIRIAAEPLPRTASGKLQRAALSARAASPS